MKHSLLVRTIHAWGGKDRETQELGMFRLRLPGVSLPFSLRAAQIGLDTWFMYELEQLLELEISKIAKSSFGTSNITVCVKNLRFGSLELLATISLVGGSVFKFFKDYEAVRAGVRSFVKDIERVGSYLEKVLNKKIQAKEGMLKAEKESKSIHRMRFGR